MGYFFKKNLRLALLSFASLFAWSASPWTWAAAACESLMGDTLDALSIMRGSDAEWGISLTRSNDLTRLEGQQEVSVTLLAELARLSGDQWMVLQGYPQNQRRLYLARQPMNQLEVISSQLSLVAVQREGLRSFEVIKISAELQVNEGGYYESFLPTLPSSFFNREAGLQVVGRGGQTVNWFYHPPTAQLSARSPVDSKPYTLRFSANGQLQSSQAEALAFRREIAREKPENRPLISVFAETATASASHYLNFDQVQLPHGGRFFRDKQREIVLKNQSDLLNFLREAERPEAVISFIDSFLGLANGAHAKQFIQTVAWLKNPSPVSRIEGETIMLDFADILWKSDGGKDAMIHFVFSQQQNVMKMLVFDRSDRGNPYQMLERRWEIGPFALLGPPTVQQE